MAGKDDEQVNTPESPAPGRKDGGGEGMQRVDQGAQEKAAEEREQSGGYD